MCSRTPLIISGQRLIGLTLVIIVLRTLFVGRIQYCVELVRILCDTDSAAVAAASTVGVSVTRFDLVVLVFVKRREYVAAKIIVKSAAFVATSSLEES